MRILRGRKVARVISVFLLITILQPLAAPYYTYAVTHGAHQPEYTAYEEPGATDMVNLLTGDFTYSLPVMEVPGPSGNFSVPLTYNAGIGPEQQGSWTGLGWNINVGAITRSVNQFPDDAAGESHTVRVMDLTGLRGWQSSMLGLGTMGWNNVQGHFGNISLLSIINSEWSEHSTSVGIAGFNIKNGLFKFDALQFGLAVVTVVSYGTASGAAQGASTAATIAKQAAIELAIKAAMSAVTASATPSAPTAGYWKYSKRSRQRFLYKEFKIWLDQTRVEDMYGVLYSGRASLENYVPASNPNLSMKNGGTTQTIKAFQRTTTSGSTGFNEGSASDINFQIDETKGFKDTHNPSFLAPDDFTVSGPGISGAIEPYRLDVGSVSMPREMTDNHRRLALVPYVDYKVPFQYKGSSNEYFHHVGGATSVTSPLPRLGISIVPSGTTPTTSPNIAYDLNDVTYKDQRVRSDLASMANTTNTVNKFPQGRHVEWLTNAEIRNTQTYPASGFLDFLPYTTRQDFRSNYTLGTTGAPSTYYGSMQSLSATIPVNATVNAAVNPGDPVTLSYSYAGTDAQGQPQEIYNSINTTVASEGTNTLVLNGISTGTAGYGLPVTIDLVYYKTPQVQNGIGGYVVTAQDGTNYHYALPVYDYNEKAEVIDKTDANKKSVISRAHPFANTWLLTAITGSDFVDRNNNGLADKDDWGYWVRFHYGKYDDDYKWRAPYSGYRRDFTDATNNYKEGFKQIYYLNTVETASHVALFFKSPRLDGKGVNGATLLKLDEICLLSREHYEAITAPVAEGGLELMTKYSDQITATCLSSAVSATLRNYLNKNTVKRVVLTHTYDLCKSTPNSSGTGGGKLTLTRVSLKGRNDLKIVPDYVFEYGDNVAYGANLWDGWDMYSASGSSAGTSHAVVSSGTQWSLNKIITPLGSEVTVAYERDTYSNVSGYENIGSRVYINQGQKAWYDHGASDIWTGGSGSELGIAIRQGKLKVGSVVNLKGSAALRCVDGTSWATFNYDTKHLTVTYIDEVNEVVQFDKDYYLRPFCAPTEQPFFDFNQATMDILYTEKPGGNIRVASIAMTDEVGSANKIRYLYKNGEGFSSGSVSQEPEYVRSSYIPASVYQIGFAPRTPVIYGMVTVLNGVLTTDADYHTKTVYEFETPSSDMIVYRPANSYSENATTYKLATERWLNENGLAVLYQDKVFLKEHIVEDHSAKVGALKSIRVYQQDGTQTTGITMTNDEHVTSSDGSQYAGIFTQGTLMTDLLTEVYGGSDPTTAGVFRYHKMDKTTVITYPYEQIAKTEVSRDGATTVTKNYSWDKYTGEVLDQSVSSSLGLAVRSVQVPAYTKYAGMGPKALGGKNILNAEGASYQYKADASGNKGGLIAAKAQTWRSDWNNYRVYNATTGIYADATEGAAVWRKAASYVWKGDYQRFNPADATHQFTSANEFSFTAGAANAGWQKSGEAVRYDHFSMPLDSRDINNIASSVKMGYNDRMMIAQASNAYYNEMAFSSAEDKLADRPFFGGEVGLGNGAVLKKSKGETSVTHTGDAVVSLATGTAFVYKTNTLRLQTYRAKVWSSTADGRIYYKINGGAEVTSTSSRKVGNWYLLSADIPVTATVTAFEVGVKSAAGTVLFDDFRFQPLKSNMSCYVYSHPALDYANATTMTTVNYVLNDENLYTKYEYDERGDLVRTYRESFQYGEKLVSENKTYYKRINQ